MVLQHLRQKNGGGKIMSSKPFNINAYLSQQQTQNDAQDSGSQRKIASEWTFEGLHAAFEKHFEEKFEKESDAERKKMLQLRHDAIVGIPQSVTRIMEMIQSFLNQTPMIGVVDLPEYYQGLVRYAEEEQQKYNELTHAIYHEVFGFGPLAHWRKYPESYAAQVIGRKIFLHINGQKQKMPFEFKSLDYVDRIIKHLTYHHEINRISKNEPTLETDLWTGERVTVTIPPKVRNPVMTIRRFLIGFVTLEIEVQKGLFPSELINVIRGLSKTNCNSVVAGPPGTGKSTFIKALFHERNENATAAMLEKHYELGLDRDYPDRAIVVYIANEQDFHHAVDQVLRSDADFGIVGEVRRVEVEGYLLFCERLPKGALTSYHTYKVNEIPAQWARLVLDQFPTRDFKTEMGRVATHIDLVLELRQSEDKTKKWLHSIQEMRYNSYTQEISTQYLVKYNTEDDVYEYSAAISTELLEEMKQANKEWAEIVIRDLQKLAQQSPITGESSIYYNPVSEQPLHRVAEILDSGLHRLQKG